MSLVQKTISGLSWSFIDNSFTQGIGIVVQIVLANLLTPEEFGVVGLITFFVVLSITFIDSGFGNALIRKTDCTQADYSTVFYFNMAVGIFLYLLLFFSAPLISGFFNEPILIPILRIVGISLIFNAASVIQLTLLTKNIDFKTKTKISLSAELLAGGIAIAMAYKGFGVWSLVARSVMGPLFTAIFIWMTRKWHPILIFSTKSFKELFGFGFKMLLSTLIHKISLNIYYVVIGKFFSTTTLGLYTQAGRFNVVFSSTLTGIIQRVSYPVLSTIQNDPEKLKNGYRKLIKSSTMIIFSLLLGLASVSEPLITILIGEKWIQCVPFLQLMCIASIFYPLHAMNLNVLMVKGRSDLFLKLEIIKMFFNIPLLVIGVFFGIKALLIGNIVISILSYFLNSYYSSNLINYSSKEQILDVLPMMIVAGTVSLIVWSITFLHWNYWATIILQIVAFAGLTIGIYEAMKQPDYLEIKQIVIQMINKY